MSTTDRRRKLLPMICLAGTLVVAACGSSAGATATPTPAPATETADLATPVPPTPAPTMEPTEAPTAAPETPNTSANGGFGYSAASVLDYYASLGFECAEPEASTQAVGYTIQRCTRADAANGQVQLIAVVTDPDGVPGDAFAGVLAGDGVTLPTPEQSLEHLSKFIYVMLGGELGQEPAVWLVKNLGAELEQSTAGDLVVLTNSRQDEPAAGLYVELANQAFLDAPVP